jgi:hypothetical protein
VACHIPSFASVIEGPSEKAQAARLATLVRLVSEMVLWEIFPIDEPLFAIAEKSAGDAGKD